MIKSATIFIHSGSGVLGCCYRPLVKYSSCTNERDKPVHHRTTQANQARSTDNAPKEVTLEQTLREVPAGEVKELP
jgi:hypothetical protein